MTAAGAVAMDDEHLGAALRYVALNRCGRDSVATASEWSWASTRAHLTGMEDGLTRIEPIRQRFPLRPRLAAQEADRYSVWLGFAFRIP
jgi:putative transposase